jgi:BMFP domain-containing protein YqiC
VTLEELAAKVAELEARLAILEELAGRDQPQSNTAGDGDETG